MSFRLTFNRMSGSILREETIDGRRHIVVPVIAMVEGVHQGIAGPNEPGPRSYYPASILAQIAQTLPGQPVTIHHPMTATDLVSATSPEGRSFVVGTVGTLKVVQNEVRGEATLDVARLEQMSPLCLQKLRQGEPLDVSVGAVVGVSAQTGTWGAEVYDEIITSLTADHLALLPDARGACSWDDRCGVRANAKDNEKIVTAKETTMKYRLNLLGLLKTKPAADTEESRNAARINALIANKHSGFAESDREWLKSLDEKTLIIVANEMSHDEISGQLWDFVNSLDSPEYINYMKEVYDGFFIYRTSRRDMMTGTSVATRLYKRSYTVDQANAKVTVADEVQEVVEKTEYVPVETATANTNPCKQETATMTKKEKIDALVACSRTPYAETDREWLDKLDETQLDKLHANQYKPETPAPAAPAAPVANAAPVAPAEAPKPKTKEQWLAELPEEIRKRHLDLEAREEAVKSSLIEKITANKSCLFTKDELKVKDLTEIDKLARSMGVTVDPVADYTAQAGVSRDNQAKNWGEYNVPDIPTELPVAKK